MLLPKRNANSAGNVISAARASFPYKLAGSALLMAGGCSCNCTRTSVAGLMVNRPSTTTGSVLRAMVPPRTVRPVKNAAGVFGASRRELIQMLPAVSVYEVAALALSGRSRSMNWNPVRILNNKAGSGTPCT
jgi:hypothetical protein